MKSSRRNSKKRDPGVALQSQAEKDRLLLLFYELPFVGLAVTSPSSKRWLQVNGYMCGMLGYSRDELLALAWTETTHPDDLPANLALFQRLAAGEFDMFQIDKRFLRKDGAIIHTTTEVRCVRHPDGSIETVIIMVQDITERKQAEAVRTQLAAIVASSSDGIVSRSLDDKILSWNAGAERLFGYSADEAIGQGISMIFPPDRAEEIGRNRALLAQGIAFHNLETERLAKGGQRVAVSLSQSPIKNEHGIVTGVALVFRDDRERKRAERLREMEHAVTRTLAEAETIVEAVPKIIQTICESQGWACGSYWHWDGNTQVLKCAESWHVDAADVANFIATASMSINEAPVWHGGTPPKTQSGGLVRRVWMDGAPVWFVDVSREPSFRRGPIAAKAGVHSAFGFPVMAGAHPLGVMEFYSRNIEKPDEELLQVVEAIGRQIGQFMARKQAEERIRHLADFDELTGLPNRSMFLQRLEHALVQAQRHARPLAVLFIDLDYFKNINDNLGHEAGDRVLKEVAERLRGCLRDSDTVGRLGGDEFVVLMEELPRLADAAAVAQKILAVVARPFVLAAQEFHIGASIGVSVCPDDGKDMQMLLKHADDAMYRAKKQSRNNYQFYSTQMTGLSTGSANPLPPGHT
jgi:diguanylate cyclase (GGDEF)-like protein/PAS domain S-box-containing protein